LKNKIQTVIAVVTPGIDAIANLISAILLPNPRQEIAISMVVMPISGTLM
jgi:ABC-type transport system involved in cytochrome c biogenesis permease component